LPPPPEHPASSPAVIARAEINAIHVLFFIFSPPFPYKQICEANGLACYVLIIPSFFSFRNGKKVKKDQLSKIQ
jgi:hypothetical protein